MEALVLTAWRWCEIAWPHLLATSLLAMNIYAAANGTKIELNDDDKKKKRKKKKSCCASETKACGTTEQKSCCSKKAN